MISVGCNEVHQHKITKDSTVLSVFAEHSDSSIMIEFIAVQVSEESKGTVVCEQHF